MTQALLWHLYHRLFEQTVFISDKFEHDAVQTRWQGFFFALSKKLALNCTYHLLPASLDLPISVEEKQNSESTNEYVLRKERFRPYLSRATT